jgi:hypothetical protein
MTILRNAVWLVAVLGTLLGTLGSASAEVYEKAYRFGHGERPKRYGNTASFFNYDNRDDQRDFPSNGVFPGNFAGNPFFAGVGAAGWLGSNPQHQPYPYPSQTYAVDVNGRVFCEPVRVDRAGNVVPRRRFHACLSR